VRRLGPAWSELPLRIAEFGLVHRDEPSGALHGLFRLRQFSQDDGHVFCREDQISCELVRFVGSLRSLYAALGFEELEVAFSGRPSNRLGDDAVWDRAEALLADAARAAGLAWSHQPGEGAFYGPKLEFQVTDAIGRPWQLGTVQLDYAMPERFQLRYIGADNGEHQPVMIHRAILGSIERFIGIIIEHFAGAFPLWLAPVQAAVLPLSEKFLGYGRETTAKIRAAGLRVETDESNEKLGAKIRDAQLKKTPYMLVVGEKEVAAGTVSVRKRTGGDQASMPVDEFVAEARRVIAARSLTL